MSAAPDEIVHFHRIDGLPIVLCAIESGDLLGVGTAVLKPDRFTERGAREFAERNARKSLAIEAEKRAAKARVA
ncbi:hypothetical protein DFR50_1595 [Roseiarcus fermentans]|uniref:Uncharacterized protein n=1 Tax=Roseiarcus fermentans TaxID=1473586 RepID=A0A366EH54_9HYPH|nr:hypothetical protein [Roseiarcus fermentans]RBP01060.1 hypothetical protein DFR50_1595 [Roseiarcus fermentans]